jgi:hypothetical protein
MFLMKKWIAIMLAYAKLYEKYLKALSLAFGKLYDLKSLSLAYAKLYEKSLAPQLMLSGISKCQLTR